MKTKSFLVAACFAATSLAPAHFAHAQNGAPTQSVPDFKTFLSGNNRPLTLKFRDLTPQHRRIVVAAQSDSFSTYIQMMGAATGVEMGVYFTRGETVSIGEETYLVAYRPQTPLDAAAIRNFGHGDPVVPTKPSPNAELALSLLNLRTAGSLNDVRPFDAKRDMQTPAEGATASVRTLEILGRGVRQAIYSNNGIVPKVGKVVTAQLRRAFYPHVHDERTWRNPMTDEYYTPNPAISGLKLSRVTNTKFLPAFYEAEAASDDTRGVLFLDGHVERVSVARWQRISAVKPKMRPMATNATVVPMVKTALGSNSSLSGANIDVEASGGRIILTGTARSRAQKVLAGRVALKAAPNYTVVNKLKAPGSKGTAVTSGPENGTTTTVVEVSD
ncbi:MAG TPA: BON domain-containing protein [Abditibacteriaceae bacterium]|jgi:prepilin-type processing-associated H-X9-DG protein